MYNFKDFDAQFPDDAACLDFIFRARYLQNYVNEFAFRYNRRFDGCDVLGEMFSRTGKTDSTPAISSPETSI